MKLVVGATLVLLLPALLILAYGAWAGTPGAHDAPFRWSMTLPAWKLCASLQLVYLGAFASGLSPGWWFGTRLAPLVTSIVLAMAMASATWWWLTLPIGVAGAMLLLVVIFYLVEERDY